MPARSRWIPACLGMTTLLFASFSRATPFPWPTEPSDEPVERAFAPPPSFNRIDAPARSFGAWLRSLPARRDRDRVRLYNGDWKLNQAAHAAILDIDVGTHDLQQCADAVIRLRAEYLWATDARAEICFRFTSGHAARWTDWRAGLRPKVAGSKVSFVQQAGRDPSYQSFRRYLSTVFTYAGSASLEKELEVVRDSRRTEIGDVFIQGGFPGHAVIVIDVAQNEKGERVFLLAQSYMPAQDIHVLRQPGSESAWYPATGSGTLRTPEWTFDWQDLRRFTARSCAGRN